tara:strand:+ start:2675 stop:2920 length:246 start_codon:yes stop_codon:yes gene_type:complete
MTVYQYKITALVDDKTTMIINLFTSKDMDDILEREEYMYQLLENGVIPDDINFERINEYESDTPYFKPACEGMMYVLENPN